MPTLVALWPTESLARVRLLILGGEACVAGRTYAVLRETRMAAVICEPVATDDVGSMRTLVVRGADVARAVVRGVRHAVEQPTTGDPP